MNENHLQQIFANYIDRFEEFNSKDKKKPSEYYKWTMPKKFKKSMDQALKAQNGEEFNRQLSEIGKITQDFIDSGKTLPFAGLVKFAGEYGKWETVQTMFRELYADDNGNLERRQRKIQAFLHQAHQLRETYNLSDLYKSDFRSVTCYLLLYDPDHNYIYKPTDAQNFQDCIEVYSDFGSGDCVNLKAYYQMCDQLVEAIGKSSAIRETKELRASKFEANEEPYEDKEWHILAYDIIYCCSAYKLFPPFTPLTPTEREVMREKQEKAKKLFEQLKMAQEEQKAVDAALKKVNEWFSVGKNVVYKMSQKGASIENGVILKNDNEILAIDFGNGNIKKMGTIKTLLEGYIQLEEEKPEPEDWARTIEVLRNKEMIQNNLANAKREFAPYSEYL